MNTTVTGVCFQTEDPLLARLVPQAEKKCLTNIKDFGPDKVLVEGGGYEKIWLETQPWAAPCTPPAILPSA